MRGNPSMKEPLSYCDRDGYRSLVATAGENFLLAVRETDLMIHAPKSLKPVATDLVLQARGAIEAYISQFPEFLETLSPWIVPGPAPAIIREMAEAGARAGVGPMAAVAGAVAEHVGRGLLSQTDEIVVENGGDVFLKKNSPVTVGIFAGASPLSLKLGLRIDPGSESIAVCASSGTVGHSLSMGKADAVCAVSRSCALADAVATSMGNFVKTKKDIGPAIDFGKRIQGVDGLVVIMGDKIGAWGELEIVPMNGKKG